MDIQCIDLLTFGFPEQSIRFSMLGAPVIRAYYVSIPQRTAGYLQGVLQCKKLISI